MKRVVIVGADFVPSSLPPALRIRSFVTHLPEFGWEPTVITTDAHHYDTALDPELERLVPRSVRVLRTSVLPRRWTRLFGVGDLGMRSLWQHWRVLQDLCRQRAVDVVLLPVPPYVPMVLGRLAYSKFSVPYVIDYIDPWATDYYWSVPRRRRPPKWALAYAIARLLEPLAATRVAHIVGVSKGTTDSVRRRYPWLRESDATEIPYGGETGDWEYIRQHPRINRVFDPCDGFLHVCSVGAYAEAMRPVLAALFAAVRRGRATMPDLFARLRLHFVGTNYGSGLRCVMPIAEELSVVDLVDEWPRRIPYLDALQLLSDAHALLVVGSEEPHYTASKIFPYILASRPLLAIFHRASSVTSILEQTGGGEIVSFSADDPVAGKVDEIVLRLRELLLKPKGYIPPTRWDAFEAYTTRAMAGRLAGVLDTALLRRSAAATVGQQGSKNFCSTEH